MASSDLVRRGAESPCNASAKKAPESRTSGPQRGAAHRADADGTPSRKPPGPAERRSALTTERGTLARASRGQRRRSIRKANQPRRSIHPRLHSAGAGKKPEAKSRRNFLGKRSTSLSFLSGGISFPASFLLFFLFVSPWRRAEKKRSRPSCSHRQTVCSAGRGGD